MSFPAWGTMCVKVPGLKRSIVPHVVAIIPALGKLRQEDHEFKAQPGLHSETLRIKQKNHRRRRESCD
jgi:hypothetical protein